MNREILLFAKEIKEIYENDPWYGRNAKKLLEEVDEQIAYEKPSGQHSIIEIIWHMINWKEFAISRIRKNEKDLHYYETNDWRVLDHNDKALWQQGLHRLYQTQNELVELIQQQKDELLSQPVAERNYDFRKLLNGIADHDVYHLGQIAYINKLLKQKS
jgi:uncharacterized damage-inducible protein DinB